MQPQSSAGWPGSPRRWWGLAKDVWFVRSLGEAAGVWKIVGGGVIGVGIGVQAALDGMPTSVALVIGLAGCAVVVWLINGFLWLRGQRVLPVQAREPVPAPSDSNVVVRPAMEPSIDPRVAVLLAIEEQLASSNNRGLQLDGPDRLIGYSQGPGRVDLTLQFTVRDKRAYPGIVETTQGRIEWPSGAVTKLESERLDQPIPATDATTVQRQVQWMIAPHPRDLLDWVTTSSGELAIINARVTFEVFVRLLDESVRLQFQNELEVHVRRFGS